MPFQVSPGVNVSEIDLSQYIPAPATSVGAIAGPFEWGPAEKIVQVSTEKELVDTFGKPSTEYTTSTGANTINAGISAGVWFTAASFLSYSRDLRIVRTSENNDLHAANSAGVATTNFKNEDAYDQWNGGGITSPVVARYAGALGNSLKVSIFSGTSAEFDTWEYKSYFNGTTGTSNYVATKLNNTIANDEMHLVVVDEDGKISGTANSILERYVGISKATNALTPAGESNYWKDVIRRQSKWIYVTNTPVDGNWNIPVTNTNLIFVDVSASGNIAYSLTGGLLDNPSLAEQKAAYDLFIPQEGLAADVSLIMSGVDVTAGGAIGKHINDNICLERRDCIVCISPERADVVGTTSAAALTAVKEFRNAGLSNVSSSYAVMDSGWKYVYDKYNARYLWVPLNGDIAGVCARTDNERDPWFSPAGLQRGQIKNAIKLAFNPTKAQRDELYKNGINPVISSAGDGTILFGDKTLQKYASAFDRINVRRLFIVLEKAISRAARASLFEFNDPFTRAQFVNLVEPFLRTVQGRRGIYDYRVVCDETNNTADVIDRNEFVGDIYVKPARSINFIQLNFVAVPTGVSFEEVIGQF
jgi:hypothetical protein